MMEDFQSLSWRKLAVGGLDGMPILASSFFFCEFQRHVINKRRRLAAVTVAKRLTGIIQIPQLTCALTPSSSVFSPKNQKKKLKLDSPTRANDVDMTDFLVRESLRRPGCQTWLRCWSGWLFPTSYVFHNHPNLLDHRTSPLIWLEFVRLMLFFSMEMISFWVTGRQSSVSKQARTVVWIHCWPSRLGLFVWLV